MKILKILREEMDEKFEFGGQGMTYVDNEALKRRLSAAGFDMTRRFYQKRDSLRNCTYAQKDHEEEDIKTAFAGE